MNANPKACDRQMMELGNLRQVTSTRAYKLLWRVKIKLSFIYLIVKTNFPFLSFKNPLPVARW